MTGQCVCMMCPFECPTGTRWSNEECDCVKCSDPRLSGRGCANRDGSPLAIVGGDDNEDDDDQEDPPTSVLTNPEHIAVLTEQHTALDFDLYKWPWDRCN